MRFIHSLGCRNPDCCRQNIVYKRDFSVSLRLPTPEELAEVRRKLGAYDDAERERVRRLAFPSPPPESS